MPLKSNQGLTARDRGGARAQAGFSVHPKRYGDDCMLTVGGELDMATHDALRDELLRAEASEAKRILLDLSEVTFIDSTGICLLVEAQRRSSQNGRRLRIFEVSDEVRDLLELTGVIGILDFVK